MSSLPQNGSLVKWAEKKAEAVKLAERLRRIGGNLYARGCRMAECGEFVAQTVCPKCGRVHSSRAQLCRDRLCPICGWRLSLARFSQMAQVLSMAAPVFAAENVYAQMVTLTVRNVPIVRLSAALKALSAGWAVLRHRKVFREGVIGWARNTEITFNKASREVHPHIHVILLWRGSHRDKAEDFGRHIKTLWRDCMKLDYNPICDARKCYAKSEIIEASEAEAVRSAALEASKYCVKGSHLGEMSDNELDDFAQEIKGYRFAEYGGFIKILRQKLGYSDDDYTIEPENCSCGEKLVQIVARWSGGTYLITSIGEVPKNARQ